MMATFASDGIRRRRFSRRAAGIVALVAALVAPAQLRANDGWYALDAAGLRLSKADRIAVVREDLNISFSEVRVRYRIRNLDARVKTGTIGFPIPHPGLLDDQTEGPGPDGVKRLLGTFSVKVNGRRVRPAGMMVQILAVRDAEAPAGDGDAPTLDITDILRRAGLDPDSRAGGLLAHLEKTDVSDKVLAALPEAYRAGYPFALRGWLIPYWRQTFQPGETLTIEHVYRPSPGQILLTSFELRDEAGNPTNPREQIAEVAGYLNQARERLREDLEEAYRGAGTVRCSIEEAQVAGILERHLASLVARLPPHIRGARTAPVRQGFSFMSYILETARSWHGPIGNFSLTINGGGRPVLFCFPGPIELVDRDKYVYRTQLFDFVPKADLDLTRLD